MKSSIAITVPFEEGTQSDHTLPTLVEEGLVDDCLKTAVWRHRDQRALLPEAIGPQPLRVATVICIGSGLEMVRDEV